MRCLSKILIPGLLTVFFLCWPGLPVAHKSVPSSARHCLAPHYLSAVNARNLARTIINAIFEKNRSDLGFYGREMRLGENPLSEKEKKFLSYDIVWEKVLPEAAFLRDFVDSDGREGADFDAALKHLDLTKNRQIKEWLSKWAKAHSLDFDIYGYYESRAEIMCFEFSVIILAQRMFPEFFTDRSDFDFLFRSIVRRTEIVKESFPGGARMDLKYAFDFLENTLETNGEVILFAAHELGHRMVSRTSLWFNCSLNDRVKWFRGIDEMFCDIFAFAFMEMLGLEELIDRRLAKGADGSVLYDEHDVSLTHLRDLRPLMKLHSISYRDLARAFFLELMAFDKWTQAPGNKVPYADSAVRVPVVDIELMFSA